MIRVLQIAAVLLVLYLIVVVFLWRYQERLAFPGDRGPLPHPADAGLRTGRPFTLTAPDSAVIHGWYLPPVPPTDTVVPGLLWLHGNRENIGDIAPVVAALRPSGMGLVVIDYRGYGESRGRITEDAMYTDAELAYDHLASRPEIDPDRIAVYGRSIGSSLALELTRRRPVRSVILDSPFTTARAMGRRHYPFLPSFLGRLELDNLARARALEAPLLVLHGEDDYIAPVEMGRAVARAGNGELAVVPGAGHNDLYRDLSWYRDRMHRFLSHSLGLE